jgi:hypothetical protein
MGRHEEEAERGRMWLRLNAQQTADLTPEEFCDPDMAIDVARAIADRRWYSDRTSVIYVTPTVGRAILRWSDAKGKTNTAHRLGARAMRTRMFPKQNQPLPEELATMMRSQP